MPSDHTRRAAVCEVGALLSGCWLAGCAGDDAGGDGRTVVQTTEDLAFEPRELTVTAGETVVWVNRSDVPHTVTAYADRIPAAAAYFASGGFDDERAARAAYPPRGGLKPDVSYRHTVRTPGRYEYFCIPHESDGMRGRLTVRGP